MPRRDGRGWSQVMADEEAGRSGLVAPDEEAGHPVVVASDKEAGWQGMIAPARGGRSERAGLNRISANGQYIGQPKQLTN